jgi:hypothetical protein
MKKRKYEKPSIEVVVLKQQARLMAGSVQSPSNTVKDYNWNTEVEE